MAGYNDFLKMIRSNPKETDKSLLQDEMSRINVPNEGNVGDLPLVTDTQPLDIEPITDENPLVVEPIEPSLFDKVSGQYQNQEKLGNVNPYLGNKDTYLNPLSKALSGAGKSKRAPAVDGPAKLDTLQTSQAAPLDPYGNELNDAALKAAQADKAKWAGIASMGKGADKILSAATHSKIDSSAMDDVIKRGEAGEKDILTRRAGKDKELERQSALIKGELEQEKGNATSFVSQTYREIAKKLKPGLNIPDGVTAAQLETVLPVLKELAKKEMDEYQRVRLEQAWRRLDLGDKTYGLKEKTQNWREKEKGELSDKQVEAVDSLDQTMGVIDEIDELKPAFGTGPLTSRVADFRRATGFDDAKMTAFKQKLGRNLANYIRSMSGLAVTDQERAYLTTLVPNDKLDDAAFLESIKTFRNELERTKSRKLENFRRQGKEGVSAFTDKNVGYKGELSEPPKQKDSKPSAGSVVTVKGKRYRVADDGDTLEEI